MLTDKLIDFSRSLDVLYAIDAKAGNGRLLSPIQGKLTLLDQDPSASTVEEKQGYLSLYNIDIEGGCFSSSNEYYDTVTTPIDLRGRSTSFSIVCKATIQDFTGYSQIVLLRQGSYYTATGGNVISLWSGRGSYLWLILSVADSDNQLSTKQISLSNVDFLDKEIIYIITCDWDAMQVKLYANGEEIGSVDIPSTAVSLASNDDATVKLFNTSANGAPSPSISYFAMVDYAMSAEEIKALGEGGGGTLELIEEDTSQWQSFTMSGGIFSSTTFTLSNGVYTSGTMSFIATDTGWSLDGFAMGLTTTDDVEYPYQATNWLQAGSAVTLTFTKIS